MDHTASGAGVRPAVVEKLLSALSKTLRAYHLYDLGNPAYQRFASTLQAEFRSLWHHLDQLEIRISEDEISWNDQTVYANADRSESLSFLLHKDGVRGLRFQPGFEEEELDDFLAILNRAEYVKSEEDDLVTLLWEGDFTRLAYSAAELISRGVEIPEPSEEVAFDLLQVQQLALEQGPDGDEVGPSRGGAPGMGSGAGDSLPAPDGPERFEPSAHVLSEAEQDLIDEEVERERKRNTTHDVATALLDSIENDEGGGRADLVRCLGPVLRVMLLRGSVANAVSVVEEVHRLDDEEGLLDEAAGVALGELRTNLSRTGLVARLIERLGEHDPSESTLFERLSHYLDAPALPDLVRAMVSPPVERVGPTLRHMVEVIAQKHPTDLVELLDAEDPDVVIGATRALEGVQVERIEPRLAELLGRPEPAVRLAAIERLVAMGSSPAAGLLAGAINDRERNVRIAAVDGLVALHYVPARDALRARVSEREFQEADLAEKRAFLGALGTFADQDAVRFLDRILNAKGVISRRETPEMRACAALALSRAEPAEARKALEKASGDKDPLVRHAVDQALRGEG